MVTWEGCEWNIWGGGAFHCHFTLFDWVYYLFKQLKYVILKALI